MSTPKNHHFLSQVLIKKFLDSDGKLNYYSKSENFITNKEFSRFDFAEDFLNSIVDDNGFIDHKSVEDNLNHNFEQGFNRYYESFFSALKKEDYEMLTDSIKFMIRMGIIGDMRTPEHQIETQFSIFSAFNQISRLADSKLQQEIGEFYNRTSFVKNKLPVDYNEVAVKVQELMSDCMYSVFIAEDNEYFFLPDNSAVTIRSKLDSDIDFNGEILESLSRLIATVIFPINSQTIIVSQSTKICPQKSHGIYKLRGEAVYNYNKMILDSARDKVICANNEYLQTFISKLREEG